MHKKLLFSILFIILLVFQVNGTTESDLSASCNLVDYTEDCAKLGAGLFIRCSTDAQIDLATCLSIWHGGAGAPTPECTADADCTDEDYSYCNDDGDCVECLENDDCTDEDYSYCNVNEECVECLEDSDCSSGYDCEDYECEAEVECETDDDCGADEICEDDVCEKAFCIENWQCSGWSSCYSGKQIRACTDLNDCDNEFPYIEPVEEQDCTPTSTATCVDGILNQGETGIDCGGPCPACKTCYDDEQNCHDGVCESGVDCGGSCMPCVLEEASKSPTFWIIFITVILIIILLIVGLWYFKLKKGAEQVGEQVDRFTKRPPPVQPSSMLRI